MKVKNTLFNVFIQWQIFLFVLQLKVYISILILCHNSDFISHISDFISCILSLYFSIQSFDMNSTFSSMKMEIMKLTSHVLYSIDSPSFNSRQI